MNPPPIIALTDVQFGYTPQAPSVFDALSLEIYPGTVTAVLGPNGAGKTTLLHLILGLLAPKSGKVLLAQRPRGAYAQQEIGRLVGVVSQDEYIPFNFTVEEYVLLGRAPHLQLLQTPGATDRAIARQALEQIAIQSLAARPIQSLSGGERQLVMIARALAQQPRILLLDEPTAHLDLSNKGHVLAIMRQLTDAGVTVVFTTHEPDLAASVAGTIILMRQGEVLGAGPMETTLTSEALSKTYGVAVEVIEVEGRKIVLPPISDHHASNVKTSF